MVIMATQLESSQHWKRWVVWSAVLAPVAATAIYRPLVDTIGFAVPATIYGACVALACSVTDSNLPRRAIATAIVAAVAFHYAETFEAVMLFWTMTCSGLVAAGRVPRFRRLWPLKHALLRVCRVIVAAIALVLADLIPLAKWGDPFSDAHYTGIFTTFLVVTYIPVIALILFDAGAYSLWARRAKPASTEATAA
jgi:hypothetical protein